MGVDATRFVEMRGWAPQCVRVRRGRKRSERFVGPLGFFPVVTQGENTGYLVVCWPAGNDSGFMDAGDPPIELGMMCILAQAEIM